MGANDIVSLREWLSDAKDAADAGFPWSTLARLVDRLDRIETTRNIASKASSVRQWMAAKQVRNGPDHVAIVRNDFFVLIGLVRNFVDPVETESG